MPRQVAFNDVPDRYQSRANKVEFIREHVLGLRRPEFKDQAREGNGNWQFSTETLKNVEREDRGSYATRTKIDHSLNFLLKKNGYDEVSRSDLFSGFTNGTAP